MNRTKNENTTKSNKIPYAVLAAALVASTAYAQLDTSSEDEFQDLTGDRNYVVGNAGDDDLKGGDGIDGLNGNAGNDFIDGGPAKDALAGGVGNDFIKGGEGNDLIYGGNGDDELRGGEGDDTIFGDGANCFRLKDAFPDWLYTYYDDESDPDYGNLAIEADGTTYGPVDMLFVIFGNAILGPDCKTNTVEGDDILRGGPGDDVLRGLGGIDTADYSKAASGIVVDLASGEASDDGDGGVDILVTIENILGSKKADVIYGDEEDNRIQGLGGGDVIEGRGGDDVLIGNGGADYFVFGPGDGNDTIELFRNKDWIDIKAFGPDPTITEEIVDGDLVITLDNGSPEDVVTITLENYTGSIMYVYYGELRA